MQRCVAPRRSALSLFLLPPSWNCTPGPSCTFARSDSAWLCAVRTNARVGPGTVCLPALCSGKPLRRAGNPLFNLGHQRNATLTNGGKTALTSHCCDLRNVLRRDDAGLKDGCAHVSSVLCSAVSQVRPHFPRFAETLHYSVFVTLWCRVDGIRVLGRVGNKKRIGIDCLY